MNIAENCIAVYLRKKNQQKQVTKDREENHEACRYLHHSPAANPCQRKQSNILSVSTRDFCSEQTSIGTLNFCLVIYTYTETDVPFAVPKNESSNRPMP
jgi:hypothetical protein